MKSIFTSDDLKFKIEALEREQDLQLESLKDHLEIAKQSLRPLNIIKSTFSDIVLATPSLKSELIGGAIALSTNYLYKNSLLGNSSNKIVRVAGRGLKLLLNNIKRFI